MAAAATTDIFTQDGSEDSDYRDYGEISEEDCLRNRKWWCFLLSSICTFLMGILSVLFVRAFAALFCRKVR